MVTMLFLISKKINLSFIFLIYFQFSIVIVLIQLNNKEEFTLRSHMQNMQSKHFMVSRYLKRRSTLFLNFNLNQYHPLLKLKKNNVSQERKWLIDFVEACEKDPISLKQISQLIWKKNKIIDAYSEEILEVLHQLLENSTPSKVSNIVYNLCLNGFGFFETLKGWISKLLIKQKKWNQIVFLTDMFLFGIHVTQQQFYSDVFCSFIQISKTEKNKLKLYRYISHFLPVFCEGLWFNKKNKEKVYSQTMMIMKKNVKFFCQTQKKNIISNLKCLHENILTNEENTQVLKEAETKYKTAADIFFNEYLWLGTLVNLFDEIHQFFAGGFTISGKDKQKQDIIQLSKHLNELEKDRNIRRILKMENCDELLSQIHEDLRYYPKSRDLLKIYSNQLEEDLYKIEKFSGSENKYVENLQQFMKSLTLCHNKCQSEKLSETFFNNLNSYSQRKDLVSSIFKIQKNNNISYICRVLALINIKQSHISELVLAKFKEQSLKYEKFSHSITIFIEFTKLKMIQEEMLLDNFQYHLESFTLDEVLGVLEKMGKPIYYSSLNAHIKFNDILGSISNRMKKSLTDITFVNKFHGLLTHLQKHDLIEKQQKNDHSHHSHKIKIESYEIKSQNISPLVKKFQKKIKQGKSNELCECLEDAITHNDFISTYCYANLVHQINCRKFDKSIVEMTKNIIIKNIEERNAQGACNWSRFFGELYSYEIINEKQFTDFFDDFLSKQFLKCPAVGVRLICSAIQTCKHYLIQTKSVRAMNDLLLLLLKTKKGILLSKGIKNSIIEHEIAEIMEYFNPSLISHFNDVKEIDSFLEKIHKKSDVQFLMNKLQRPEKQYKQKKQVKYVELKNKSSTPETNSTVDDQITMELQKLELNFSPVNSDMKNASQKKKVKVITRKKNDPKQFSSKQVNLQ